MKKLISLLSLAMLLSVNVLTPISYATENLWETGIIPENGSGMSENNNESSRAEQSEGEGSSKESEQLTWNQQDFYPTSGASASPQNGEWNGQTPQSDNNVSSWTVAKDSEISPLDEGGTVELSEFELQDSSVDTWKLQLDEHYIQNQEEYIEENSLYVQQMQWNKDDSVMMMRNIANYEDGIYDVLDRTAKTVKYWDILLTISMTDKSVNGYNLSNGYDLSTLWWEGDNADNKYDSQNDRSLRRGPCDEWWHVPSQWELVNLIYSWCMIDGGCYLGEFLDDEYIRIQLNESNMWDGIMSIVWSYNSFEIHTPWFNEFWFELSDSWISWINYNTSSYNDDNGAFFLQPYNGYVYFYNSSGKIVYNSYGDYGNGFLHYFRCFKDSVEVPEDVYYRLDFNVDGEIVDTQTMQSWKRYQWVKIADPQKEWYVFDWWYEDPGFWWEERNFDNWLLKDTVIYAKWLKKYTLNFSVDGKIVSTNDVIEWDRWSKISFCKPWYVVEWRYEDSDFWWESWDFSKPIMDDITLYAKWKLFEWDVIEMGWFKIMDRNLWALKVEENWCWFMRWAFGNSENTDSELWWGGMDSEENWRWLDLDNDEERQWPCPDWRHVPSAWEWSSSLENWFEVGPFYYLSKDSWLSYHIPVSNKNERISKFLIKLMGKNATRKFGNFTLRSSSSPMDETYYGLRVGWKPKISLLDIKQWIFTNQAYSASSMLKIRCFANNKQKLYFMDLEWNEILTWEVSIWEKWLRDGISQPDMSRDGYEFQWWSISWRDEIFDFDSESIKWTFRYVPKYEVKQYNIRFLDLDWAEIDNINQDYDSYIQKPSDPTKEWYKFLWRYEEWSDSEFDFENTALDRDVVLYAKREEVKKETPKHNRSWGGWRSWWGWSSLSHGSADDNTPQRTWDPQDSSADKSASEWQTWSVVDSSAEPQNDGSVSSWATAKDLEWEELFNMHKRAYENWLTIYKPWEDAKFDKPLTRQQMAKISSIFWANFLNQKGDVSEWKIMECSQYTDLHKSKWEMRWYVVQSCLLWNMWYAYDGVNLIKKFNPYNKLTVAQASVILSRMAWWDKYVISPKKWYQWHMYAVYDHGLIDDISNPQREITRWEAFMMMYRLSQMMETEKQ